MPTPYLSELKIFPYGFVPKGWALCDGRVLPINQNQVLFSLLGTAYGGNGTTTFALPNLMGAVPMHVGTKMIRGQTGGESTHKLIISEIPLHTHQAIASSLPNPDINTPNNNFWATTPTYDYYGSESNGQMSPNAIGLTGLSYPHDNMAPYLVLNICIAITGLFPS